MRGIVWGAVRGLWEFRLSTPRGPQSNAPPARAGDPSSLAEYPAPSGVPALEPQALGVAISLAISTHVAAAAGGSPTTLSRLSTPCQRSRHCNAHGHCPVSCHLRAQLPCGPMAQRSLAWLSRCCAASTQSEYPVPILNCGPSTRPRVLRCGGCTATWHGDCMVGDVHGTFRDRCTKFQHVAQTLILIAAPQRVYHCGMAQVGLQ